MTLCIVFKTKIKDVFMLMARCLIPAHHCQGGTSRYDTAKDAVDYALEKITFAAENGYFEMIKRS